MKECSEALKPYRVRTIVGDNYGGEWPVAEFKKHGITYQLSQKHRSQLYLELIPTLNSKRAELPDDRRMIDELRRLERRRGRSGRDTIDHPSYSGSDDVANSVAGAVNLVLSRPVMNPAAIPSGIGRGWGAEIAKMDRKSVAPLFGSAIAGEDEGESWRRQTFRFHFGIDD